MKCKFWVAAVAVVLSAVGATAAQAAVLYSENFDVDPTANWTVNNNNLGTNAANFYYDYSAVGIPSASGPGGTTRGLKIGANLNSATQPAAGSIPGISVSPTGKSFTGDYELKFQWWSNYIGPLNVGATGSTMLSNYGIMTSGTAPQYPGFSDGISFSATGDGQSATDYRAYSKERPASYGILPGSANPLDAHVVYAAGSQNSSDTDYATPFPAGATAPGVQASESTQSSSVPAGAAGFRWNSVSINKVGNSVMWTVNGTLLATVDSTTFSATLTGSNIFFGMSDTNNTTNTSAALLEKLQFTLIDNVEVHGVPEPSTFALIGLAGLGMCAMRRRS